METYLPVIQIVLCFAVAVGIVWLLRTERNSKQLLKLRYIARGRLLGRSLRMTRLGEQLAALGYWEYDPQRHRQTWSTGLFNLVGLDQASEFCKGDIEMLLDHGGEELKRKIAQNRSRREPFEIDFGAT